MTERFFRFLMDLIVRRYRRRLALVTSTLPASPVEPAGYVDTIYDVTNDARNQAWAAASLFMRGQARRRGFDEAWVPAPPPYRPEAVRRAIRETPGGLSKAGAKQLERALVHHVEGSARQTVALAARSAPPDPDGAVEHAENVEKQLQDFPEDIRKQAVRAAKQEAARQEREQARKTEKAEHPYRAMKGRKPKKQAGSLDDEDWETPEQRRARRRRMLDDELDQIADRIDRAIGEVDKEPAMKAAIQKHAPIAVEDPPSEHKLDKESRRIGRAFAWARVVHPSKNGPCGFCAMLAARGPVYKSQGTAGFAFHYGDRCTVVPVFTSRAWPGKADAARYAKTYKSVVTDKDLHGAEARSAMDRALRGKRSDEKSAARKEREHG